jgi:preprotein translocase subunit SecA
LVEYDDVINKHRETIYRKRREILKLAESEKTKDQRPKTKNIDETMATDTPEEANENEKTLSHIILEMVENEIEQVVAFHTNGEKSGDWNLPEIWQTMGTIFPLQGTMDENMSTLGLSEHKLDQAKERTIIIEYFTRRARELFNDLENKARASNLNLIEMEKTVLIRAMDTLWIEHLEAMNSVRQGIGLRGYGQRDPLIEYKKEAYQLYHELNNLIQKEVVYSIFKIGYMYLQAQSGLGGKNLTDRPIVYSAPAKEMTKRIDDRRQTTGNLHWSLTGGSSGRGENQADTVRPKIINASGDKVGRNDPCPCGSGKKFKKCHGA